MFEGVYTFLRAQRNSGVAAKTGKDYDFSTITISDGLESVQLETTPEVVEKSNSLKRGDKILVALLVYKNNFDRVAYEVNDVQLMAK